MRKNVLTLVLFAPVAAALCYTSYSNFLDYLNDLEDKNTPEMVSPPLPPKARAMPVYDVLPTEAPSTARC